MDVPVEMVLKVFWYGLITALATGLGALPFLYFRVVSDRSVAVAGAIAAGLMLGACFGLIQHGTREGTAQTVVGGALGMLFIMVTERLLRNREIAWGELSTHQSRQLVLIITIMTIHSFAEGVAVGVAFGGGDRLALLITLAVAVHNVPEGLAISAVLRRRGTSVIYCALWSIFSSLPQPIMAVPAFLFVDSFEPLLPYGLGFAAGAMVFMVFFEILPESYEKGSKSAIGLWVTITLGLMILFQEYL